MPIRAAKMIKSTLQYLVSWLSACGKGRIRQILTFHLSAGRQLHSFVSCSVSNI